MKKLNANLHIALSLVLVFLLTGCGSSTDTAATTDPGTTTGGSSGGTTTTGSTTTVNNLTLTLSPNPASVPADGVSAATVIVNVKDSYGAPIEDKTISFTATLTSAAQLSAATLQTDATGTATLTVVDPYAESVVITAKADSQTQTGTITFTPVSASGIIPSTTTPNIITLAVLSNAGSVPADGTTKATFIANVKDVYGSPIAGQPVQFVDEYANTAAQISSGEVFTDASGTAIVTVVNPIAQQLWVTASIDTGTVAGILSDTRTVVFTPVSTSGTGATTQVPANLSLAIFSNAGSVPADGVTTATFIANVKDAYGAPISNQAVSFVDEYANTAAQISSGEVFTDASGTATVTVVNPIAQSLTITASIGGLSQSGTVIFTPVTTSGTGASTQTPANLTLAIFSDGGNVPADGTTKATFIANVKDAYGAPIPNQAVFFVDEYANTAAQISSGEVFTDASGTAIVTVVNPIAQTVTITASIGGLSQSGTVIFTQVATSGTGAVVQTVGSLNMTIQSNGGLVLADGVSTATVIANVKDTNGVPIVGQAVTFSDDNYTSSVQISSAEVSTDASGTARVTIVDPYAETVTIRASVAGLPAKTASVDFVSVIPADAIVPSTTPASVGISADVTSVQADGTSVSTVTVTVLDAANTVVENATVTFGVTGGQIDKYSVVTDANGQAVVSFSAGVDKVNKTVMITAVVANSSPVLSAQIPMQITGSTVSLSSITTSITDDGSILDTLSVSVKDALGNPIYNTPVTFTQSAGTGAVTFVQSTANTNVSGQVSATITGTLAGSVTVDVYAAGVNTTQNYTVAAPASTFGITSPSVSPYSWPVATNLTVTANNPNGDQMRFVSNCGFWDGGSSFFSATQTVVTPTAVLNSSTSCQATVQAINLTTGAVSPITVNISATAAAASTLVLQADKRVLQPDTGAGGESATLTAQVRDASGNAVGGAWVLYTISNPTGGGESVTNITVQTDSFGRASNTFTAGLISTGGQGVTLKAEVIGTVVSDTTTIVIGGTPGSIVIGKGSRIFIESETTYRYPMSVTVADTNGNPMANTTVSLSAWPTEYSTGAYVLDSAALCYPAVTGTFINEDINEDTVLDAGEDSNGDGQLTPPNSASGTVPASVTTDAFGVGVFDLIYPKSSAYWITDRIRATTNVLGTEGTSELAVQLVGEKSEVEGCLLPRSPFSNVSATNVSIALSPLSTASVSNQVLLTALVTDAYGIPTSLQDVTFSFVGASNGVTLSPTSASTNLAGTAQVLVSDTSGAGGFVTVKATTGISSSTANITFLSTVKDPYSLSVAVSPSSGTNPDGITPAVVTANVIDIYGVRVPDAPIRFQVVAGSASLNQFQTITNINGTASANVTSTQAGTATIQVSLLDTYSNVDKYTNVDISFGVTPASLSLTSSVSAVPSDGSTSASITISVLDSGGLPVSGEVVTLTASGSAVLSQNTVTTDSNGQAVVSVTNTVVELVSIQATSSSVASVNDTIGITFTQVVAAVDPYTVVFNNALDTNANAYNTSVNLDVYTAPILADSYASYASGLDTVQVTYRVTDGSGAAIKGLRITLAGSGSAVVSPASATTDNSGFVTATVTDAVAETVTVTASTASMSGNQTLTFVPLPPASIQLTSTSPSPAVIGLSGAGVQQAASLTFTVVDTNNNPVQGNIVVDFSILSGGLNGGETLTVKQSSTVDGKVTAVVNAGELSGTIQVRASVNTDSTIFTDVPVSIAGGLPSGDSFTMNPDFLNIAGRFIYGLTQNITTYVADFFSNPVAPGQQVSYQTDYANVNGSASVSVASGISSAATTVTSGAPSPVDGFVTLVGSTIGGSHSKILSLVAVDTSTLYAGTDGGGVFKTTDGGATWLQTGTPLKGLGASKVKNLIGSIVRGLYLDPSNSNTLYAATEKGLFLSTDSGSNWETLTGLRQIVGETIGVASGAFNPTAGLNGRWDETVRDSGAGAGSADTFFFAYPHTGVRSRTHVYIDGVETNSYNLLSNGIELIGTGTTTLDNLAITSGTSLVTIDYDSNSTVPDFPVWDVVVDQSTYDAASGFSTTIYIAVYGKGVWKTIDGGKNWFVASTMSTAGQTFDQRVISLAINPINTVGGNLVAELFAGTDGGGLYYSSDNAGTWTRQQGINDSVIQDIVLQEVATVAGATNAWVAGKNGIHYTTDANVAVPTWTQAILDSYAGINADVRAIARDSFDGTLYASIFGDVTGNSSPLGGVYSSINGGVNWAKVTSNVAASSVTGAHRLDSLAIVGAALPANDTLFAGTEGRAVYASADSGATWSAASGGKVVGSESLALTNELFTTKTLMHSGPATVQILPLTTTYQPMNDATGSSATPGYTDAGTIYHGETHTFVIRMSDDLGNRLAPGATLSASASLGSLTGDTSVALTDGIYGGTDYVVQWTNDTVTVDFDGQPTLPGTLSVSVTSDNGGATANVSRTLVEPFTMTGLNPSVDPAVSPTLVTLGAKGGSNNANGHTFVATSGCSVDNITPATTCAVAGGFTFQTVVGNTADFYFTTPATGVSETYTVSVTDNATGVVLTETLTITGQ